MITTAWTMTWHQEGGIQIHSNMQPCNIATATVTISVIIVRVVDEYEFSYSR